jgi:hypothetical protein
MSRFFAERRVNRTASLSVAVKLVFSTDWDSIYWRGSSRLFLVFDKNRFCFGSFAPSTLA